MNDARHRHAVAAALTFLALAAGTACGGDGGPGAATLSVERDTLGDTIVVRTLAGSAWGDAVRLVEELRIGTLDGDDEYTFGQVHELAVGPDGTFYVYDGAVKALRAYDSTGAYLRTIGAEGGGPGEYRDVGGLAVLPDGRLLLRDSGLGRIAVYSATGEPLGAWPLPSGLYTSDALRTDTAGYSYAKILAGQPRPDEPWPITFVRFDGTGTVVDTLPAPVFPEAIANTTFYDPQPHWSWHPHGYVVAAFGARYAVEVRRPGQPVLRIERARQPSVPVPAGERAELDAIRAAAQRSPAGQVRPIPEVKPAIRAIAMGRDGRIWVRPFMPSVQRAEAVDTTLPLPRRPRGWTEPDVVWDVFEPDGTFLGRVPLPARGVLYGMQGDRAWGTVLDENDVPYLVRWRIESDGEVSGGAL